MAIESMSHTYMSHVYSIGDSLSPWYCVMATPVHWRTMHAHFSELTGRPKRCSTAAVRYGTSDFATERVPGSILATQK